MASVPDDVAIDLLLGEVRHRSIGQDRGGYDFAPVIIRVAQLDKGSFGFAVIARMYQSECHFASPRTGGAGTRSADTLSR
jgi:hypothetical protein